MTRIMTIANVVWLEMLRRKDAYILLILMIVMLGALLGLDVFGLGGVVVYLKDIGLLITWVLAWIMGVSGSVRQLPREERQGTIFSLLAKPVSRFELLIGKWLGVWTVTAFATLCFYAVLALAVLIQKGRFDLVATAQGYLLHCAALGVITAAGLLFSTRLHQDAAAVITYVFTGAFYAVVPQLSAMARTTPGWHGSVSAALYFLLPHLDVFDMRRRIVHDFGPIDCSIFIAIIGYGICLTVATLLLAWLAYRNKRFARADQL